MPARSTSVSLLDKRQVRVEFYGVPRLRAGCAARTVHAGTVTEALTAIMREYPGLTGLIGREGRLAEQYLLSLNGQEFVAELDRELRPGDRLLLLSADAGG